MVGLLSYYQCMLMRACVDRYTSAKSMVMHTSDDVPVPLVLAAVCVFMRVFLIVLPSLGKGARPTPAPAARTLNCGWRFK